MIRKTSLDNAACCVVEHDGVRSVFVRAAPSAGGDFQQQARDRFARSSAIAGDEGVADSLVHQTVFLGGLRQTETCRQIMRDFFASRLPATTIYPSRPAAVSCWRSRPGGSARRRPVSRCGGCANGRSPPGTAA